MADVEYTLGMNAEDFVASTEEATSALTKLDEKMAETGVSSKQLGESTTMATEGISEVSAVTEGGAEATEGYSRSMAKGADRMAIMALHATGLGESLGPLPVIMLHASSTMEMLEMKGLALDSTMTQLKASMGAIGPVALAAGAGFIGWKIGEKANELMEANGAIGKLIMYATPLGAVKVAFTDIGDAIVNVTDDTNALTTATESADAAYVKALAHRNQTTWQFANQMKEMNLKVETDWLESQKSANEKYQSLMAKLNEEELKDRTGMTAKELADHVKLIGTLESKRNELRKAAEDEAKKQADTEIAEAKRAHDEKIALMMDEVNQSIAMQHMAATKKKFGDIEAGMGALETKTNAPPTPERAQTLGEMQTQYDAERKAASDAYDALHGVATVAKEASTAMAPLPPAYNLQGGALTTTTTQAGLLATAFSGTLTPAVQATAQAMNTGAAQVTAAYDTSAGAMQRYGVVVNGVTVDLGNAWSQANALGGSIEDTMALLNREKLAMGVYGKGAQVSAIPSFQGISKPVSFRVQAEEQMIRVHRGEGVNITPSGSSGGGGAVFHPGAIVINVPLGLIKDQNSLQRFIVNEIRDAKRDKRL